MKRTFILVLILLITSFTFVSCNSDTNDVATQETPDNDTIDVATQEISESDNADVPTQETPDTFSEQNGIISFDFYIPDSVRLFPLDRSNFSTLTLPGPLPEFHPNSLRIGSEILDVYSPGFASISAFVRPEVREDAGVTDFVASFFWGLDDDVHFTMGGNTKPVLLSASGNSAFSTIPFSNYSGNMLYTISFIIQEETDGALFGTKLMIIFNELEEECIEILLRYSETIGYNVLAAAARDMANVIDLRTRFLL